MRENIFDRWDEEAFCSQGSVYGIKALGIFIQKPNNVADELELHKDGRLRRGVPPCFRLVNNAKKRGIKQLPKKKLNGNQLDS